LAALSFLALLASAIAGAIANAATSRAARIMFFPNKFFFMLLPFSLQGLNFRVSWSFSTDRRHPRPHTLLDAGEGILFNVPVGNLFIF
jgi:hypothetical protein